MNFYFEVLKHFGTYRNEGRILFSGSAGLTYEDWMEGPYGEGKFTAFANKISSGRYVCLIEDLYVVVFKNAMKDAFYLIDPEKREGKPAYCTVELTGSFDPCSIPSNLYFIGTTKAALTSLKDDSLTSFFHIKHIWVIC